MESARIRSIDIFRGLTMLVMIFVNELAGVQGLPWWTYHMPGGKNGMTYVDVVFPAFLFIVGLSIPLAISKRLETEGSMPCLWLHVVMRSAGLVVIGIVLANASSADILPPGVWALLALFGAILYWLAYPRAAWSRALKYAGLALLILMLAMFRRKTPTGEAWLDFGYWEILGLIGRAYLAACILYIPFRKKPWAPAVWLVILTACNVGTRIGMPSPERFFPHWLWVFDSGELPSVVMAGIVASVMFLHGRANWAIGYAAVLFAAGTLFLKLGISKNAATPTWCLYCSGISVLLFLIIYWLADVKGWHAWAAFVKPAGSNTLLTYLLPDLYYYAAVALAISLPFRSGWPGAVRCLVFTGCILFVSYLLTKRKIRLQL